MSKFSYRTKVIFAFIALSLTAFMLVLSFQSFRIFQIFSLHTPTQSSNQIPVGISSLSSYGQSFFSLNQDNDIRENGAKAFQEALNLLPNDAKRATAKLDEAIDNFSKSLAKNRNDPETRIYLSNAISYYPKENYSKNVESFAKKLAIPENQCSLPLSQNNPLKIAVVIPVTFSDATKPDLALEILRGVAQAQNKVNCTGGIQGRMLQIAVFGDGAKDDLADQVAQEIVKQDFLAVIGHSTSNTTVKAGSVYDNQIVAISPISTAVRYSQKYPDRPYILGKYIFRTAANDLITIDRLFDYWRIAGQNNIAIAYSFNSDYSRFYRQDFLNKLKQSNLYIDDNRKCTFDNSTFKAADCISAIKDKAKALLIIPGSNDSDKSLELLKALTDKDNIQVLSGDTMYSLDTLKLKDKAKNLVIVVHWLRSGQLTEFEKQAQAFWGNALINWRTYDAAQVVATALKESQQLQNSKEDIRQDLQKIISAPNFSAIGAFNDNIRFEDGDRKIDQNSKFGVIGRVEKIGTDKDGQDKYDFKPI